MTAGPFSLRLRLEEAAAPHTVAAFRRLLPLTSKIIHVRWSGEAGWIPMGDLDVGIGPENATSYPHPGELVLYPGGVSETELLLGYGYVNFASKAGQLAGNHFATVIDGLDLPASPRDDVAVGRRTRDHVRRDITQRCDASGRPSRNTWSRSHRSQRSGSAAKTCTARRWSDRGRPRSLRAARLGHRRCGCTRRRTR